MGFISSRATTCKTTPRLPKSAETKGVMMLCCLAANLLESGKWCYLVHIQFEQRKVVRVWNVSQMSFGFSIQNSDASVPNSPLSQCIFLLLCSKRCLSHTNRMAHFAPSLDSIQKFPLINGQRILRLANRSRTGSKGQVRQNKFSNGRR